MSSLTAPHRRFSRTEVILGEIFQSAVEDVRKSINSFWVFRPPEEEPLTFHISLSLVSKLHNSKQRILSKVYEDLCLISREYVSYSYKPPNIDKLRDKVKIRVITHQKHFEGRVSGADFGLVLTVPVAFKGLKTFKVRSKSSGCIVQAKRIISTGTKYDRIYFGRGFSRLFDHRDFALFSSLLFQSR